MQRRQRHAWSIAPAKYTRRRLAAVAVPTALVLSWLILAVLVVAR